MAQDKRISTPRPLTTRNRPVRVIVAVIIVLTAIPLAIYAATYLEHAKAQKDMTHYLQNKYGQEFVVEWPKRRASGLGVEGYREAIVYPKYDNSLRFTVRSSSSDIWDGYADRLWTLSETKRIRQELEQVMSGVAYEYEVDIGSYLAREHIKGPLPGLDEFMEKYGKAVLYTLSVKSTSSDQRTNYDKALLLMQLLKNKHSNTRLVYQWNENNEAHIISVEEESMDELLNGSVAIKEVDRINKQKEAL